MAQDMAQGMPAGAEAPMGAPAEGQDAEASLENIVSSIDSMIGQLSQLVAQADPALGQEMGEVGAHFRQVIEKMVGMAGGAEGAVQAQAPVPAQAGAGEVVPAF